MFRIFVKLGDYLSRLFSTEEQSKKNVFEESNADTCQYTSFLDSIDPGKIPHWDPDVADLSNGNNIFNNESSKPYKPVEAHYIARIKAYLAYYHW